MGDEPCGKAPANSKYESRPRSVTLRMVDVCNQPDPITHQDTVATLDMDEVVHYISFLDLSKRYRFGDRICFISIPLRPDGPRCLPSDRLLGGGTSPHAARDSWEVH